MILLSTLLAALPQSPAGNPTALLEIAAQKGVRQLATGLENTFIYAFTRGGQRRQSLVLTPGATFETSILPVDSPGCVSLMAGMPFNLGDGATLKIELWDETRRQSAVEVALDPAHVRAHRAWVPVRLNIPAGRNRVRVRFEVTAGIRGDQTADWVGIAAGAEPGCLLADRPGDAPRIP